MTATVTPNEPFIRQVLTFIRDNPASWSQDTWGQPKECGTVACIAGWSYFFATGRQPFTEDYLGDISTPADLIPVAAAALGIPLVRARQSLFSFVVVSVSGGLSAFHARPVTFADLVGRVEEITGLDLSDLLDPQEPVVVPDDPRGLARELVDA